MMLLTSTNDRVRVAAFAPLVPRASREGPGAAIGKHLDDPRRRGAEPGRHAGEKTTVLSADRAVPKKVGRLSNFYQFGRHDIPSFGRNDGETITRGTPG